MHYYVKFSLFCNVFFIVDCAASLHHGEIFLCADPNEFEQVCGGMKCILSYEVIILNPKLNSRKHFVVIVHGWGMIAGSECYV